MLVELPQTRLPDVLDEVAHAGPGTDEVAVVQTCQARPFRRLRRRVGNLPPWSTADDHTEGSHALGVDGGGLDGERSAPDEPATAYSSSPSKVARAATSRPAADKLGR
jgi:hypothetical protein